MKFLEHVTIGEMVEGKRYPITQGGHGLIILDVL